jgi:hypothetical protein
MERRYKSETELEQDVWQELGQRVGTPEGHRLVSVAVMIFASVRGFLTITIDLQRRTPRAVLAEIENARAWAGGFPNVLTEKLFHFWDRQEQELYEHIFPLDARQKAVDSVHCHGRTWASLMRRCIETKGDDPEIMAQARAVVTAEGRQTFQQEYLTHLRAQLTDPRIQAVLDEHIGQRETRGRVKTEGASIKNWPLIGEAIWMVYEILWPIYTEASEAQRPSVDPAQNEPPCYPQSLLNDIARLFRTEFPECLSDLTARDVLSRVQYRSKR